MSEAFALRKRRILEQLAVPDESYADLSPKGTVDEDIRPLVGRINAIDGLVTTSSCSGRISVFLEGKKQVTTQNDSTDNSDSLPNSASSGGKGGGGAWLFVSHSPVEVAHDCSEDYVHSLFGLTGKSSGQLIIHPTERFVHFKFEPMVSPF